MVRGQSGKNPHARAGGTFAFCAAGSATLVTADDTVVLEAGDSVYYDATTSTLWKNARRARAVCCFTSS